MKKKLKKRIIKFFVVTHQWTGFILSLMFLIWFLSGFVLMYKDFPYIQREEILAKSQSIKAENIQHPDSLGIASYFGNFAGVKLVNQLGRPLWRLVDEDGNPHSFFADTGERLSIANEEQALAIASDFEGQNLSSLSVDYDNWLDQWTPRTRFIPYLPWYKVKVDDGRGTVFYVSTVNGEVVQKLNTSDKIWAWLGAIPHWIYFKDLRITTQKWRDVVVALSIAGVLMSITGIVLGFIRYKRNRGMKFSPYKKFWFKWHHYIGFVFGLFVFTWILSGLFSMNPWSWSPPANLDSREKKQWEGEAPNDLLANWDGFKLALVQTTQKGNFKELSFGTFHDQVQLIATFTDRKPISYLFNGEQFALSEKFDLNFIKATAEESLGAKVIIAEEIDEYDSYYIDKWKKRPLPVYKFALNDEAKTTLYVEPHTAAVLYKYTPITRLNRWLYHGLHSLDIPVLMKYRPLWDIIVFVLMIGGTAVSITGVIMTWNWLVRKARKKQKPTHLKAKKPA